MKTRLPFCPLLVLLLLSAVPTAARARRVVLPDFPALQQTTDYTCGPVSALMVLRYFGDATEDEMSLAAKMHCHVDGSVDGAPVGSARRFTDFGTNIRELADYFASRSDFRIVASSVTADTTLSASTSPVLLSDTAQSLPPHFAGNCPPRLHDYADASAFFLRHLEAGRPILVCWAAWGGHWGVVVGLDDGDTPDDAEDDLLFLADPYDTFDRQRDSRVQVPLALFFHAWYCAMTPKPDQLQPYLVVEHRQ